MKLIRKLTERLARHLQDQRGVTLIELLAVIVILGIIAAIGIPALMDSREKAQQEAYNTNASIMTEAAKRKILMGQKYATSISADEKEFNLEELLTEANIAHGNIVEVTAPEGGDITEFGNATAFVDDSDESKGTYELNVANGTVVYNKDGSTEEDTGTQGEETPEQPSDSNGSNSLDVEREPVVGQ